MFVKKLMVKQMLGGKNPSIFAVIAAHEFPMQEDGKTPNTSATPKRPEGLYIGRVFANAERIITRDSPYENGEGDNKVEGLKGMFKAEMPDGKTYESMTAYLPSVAHEALKHALRPTSDGETPQSVTGVFDIFAVISHRDPNKYEYRIEPVVAPEVKVDPFAHLSGKLPPLPTLKQLEAPKTTEAPALAPERELETVGAESPAPKKGKRK